MSCVISATGDKETPQDGSLSCGDAVEVFDNKTTCDNKKYHTVNNDSYFKGKRFEKTK